MEVVLGVSMTPTAVRMVLVEGAGGDGVTLDTSVAVPGADAAEQVVAAILGTREGAVDGLHQLAAVGVAWTDHADGARLRDALRAADIDAIDDVVMVSELHAASALAQAVGRRLDYARTVLLFVERDDVTLAVVRTGDGAVVAVRSRVLVADDPADELRAMVAELEHTAEPPEAVFLVGAGRDVAMLAERVAEGAALPVHAPDEAELALARGAALAAASAPRFEAATVRVSTDSTDTLAAQTQLAAAGYMAPLGYSALVDDNDNGDDEAAEATEAADKPFLLVGSALAAVFVIGVAALVISLAVRIAPAVEQRPEPPAPAAQQPAEAPPPPAIETIQAPRPVAQEVVQQAPRTVFVPAPAAVPPAPAPVAPAPEPVAAAPAPAAPPAPAPVDPVPIVPAPAAPAPALPPIVLAPLIPLPFLQSPIKIPAVPTSPAPATSAPAPAPATSAPAPAPATSAPAPAPATSAPAPAPATPSTPPALPAITTPTVDSPAPETSGKPHRRGGSGSDSGSSPSPIWPLWPSFGN